jgi:hypothetical protein
LCKLGRCSPLSCIPAPKSSSDANTPGEQHWPCLNWCQPQKTRARFPHCEQGLQGLCSSSHLFTQLSEWPVCLYTSNQDVEQSKAYVILSQLTSTETPPGKSMERRSPKCRPSKVRTLDITTHLRGPEQLPVAPLCSFWTPISLFSGALFLVS